jgi:hypothetical protein
VTRPSTGRFRPLPSRSRPGSARSAARSFAPRLGAECSLLVGAGRVEEGRLANLVERRGDLAGAERHYRQAAEGGDTLAAAALRELPGR